MANRIPVEPSAAARTCAKVIHDQFLALVSEGFTEEQALDVLKAMIASPHRPIASE